LNLKGGVGPSRSRPILQGLVTAIVGAIMIGAGTITLSNLYVGRWTVAVVATEACILACAAFKGMYAKCIRSAKMPVKPDR